MNQGRAMRNVARWGIIEERLMDAFVAFNQTSSTTMRS